MIFRVYNENSIEERTKMYKELNCNKFFIDYERNIKFNFAVFEIFSKDKIIKIPEDMGFKTLTIKKSEIFYLIEAI